ncbi:TPA: phosphonate ABC transporter ATP-binding protein [Escherichia coli]|uniref:phosphonate ABC transporter ATP-binding protein n=7 Tax=Enterobacteriaceae TaxID=543 RepID=UPI000BE6A762|nr:phosphonate ABC transporter ATP-binding protein [Escherichia coli]EFO1643185.1 phosphonate ABC transporter ATP-binding protein [Escherichia coli]HDV1757011.1 phosphonate ABC transporter ATP-binding protein [Escherichia coli]HDV1807970.1 phosphonate ABC transporter ATP-binding protein [Escherichia coli]HDV1821753.1 phosphonate ABC transporter ATP-binding protein [Escherichia coli]HDV2639169.1 phosphonate ABC transporter ATP-binding protein [Escherichia coli]
MQTIIRVEKLAKTFNQHQALHAVDLNIHHGEMVALLGPSGSGKSTLLRHLSGLITGDKSAGSHIELLGRTVQREGRLARDIRKSRANTGYIFQQFNLVNRLSVLENVLIGALGSTPFWRTCFSWFTREQKQRALQALTRVGMVHFAHQRVSTLSGGQQQRVAIARALMQQAKVILADEPIASLDPESARIVMDTLRDINQNDGITVVVTLHQVDYALRDINQNDGITVVVTLHQVDYALRYCERIVALRQGHVFYDGSSQQFDNERFDHLYRSINRVEENAKAA